MTLRRLPVKLGKEEAAKLSSNTESSQRLDTFTLGGLHMDDFAWASKEYEETGYVLIGFVLDVDGYHWKAVYVKAEQLEEKLKSGQL